MELGLKKMIRTKGTNKARSTSQPGTRSMVCTIKLRMAMTVHPIVLQEELRGWTVTVNPDTSIDLSSVLTDFSSVERQCLEQKVISMVLASLTPRTFVLPLLPQTGLDKQDREVARSSS